MGRRHCILVACSVLILGTVATLVHAREDAAPAKRWTKEIVQLAATLPVQDDGRVKPLDTVARFLLLRSNGKRNCEDLGGEKLSSMEWLLDCLFFPELARKYETFLVNDSAVLDVVGVPHDGKTKRDRYCYEELLEGRDKLFELARKYQDIEAKERTGLQNQILNLATNLNEFEGAIFFLEFARTEYSRGSSEILNGIFPKDEPVRISSILENASALGMAARDTGLVAGAPSEGQSQEEFEALGLFLQHAKFYAEAARTFAMFPPPGPADKLLEWVTPADLFSLSFTTGPHFSEQIRQVSLLEDLVQVRNHPEAFHGSLAALHESIRNAASTRGEYDKIELEVAFYRGQFFYYSLVVFVLSFVLVAVNWLRPTKWLRASAVACISASTVLLITGIVMRCIIRSRPPISTLYETILFITSVAVICSLLMEWIHRRGVSLALAAILGMGGMFLANRYEETEGKDTMPTLVAVLDTNFWLSTHVTTVTTGYAAGLLAAAIAHVFILGKLFGFRKGDKDFYKSIAKMTYGVICFGLLFSVVGTILGGIWANESWGRFWGWDPKENGALLIVLCELALLHARMGGYVRDLGFCMGAGFLGTVVAFSWWGVNLLGEGLHSYGFTSGVQQTLYSYYGFECLMLALGSIVWIRSSPPSVSSTSPQS